MHLLSQRQEAEDQRATLDAQVGLLEQAVADLRTHKPVPKSDLTLMQKISTEPWTNRAAARGVEPTEEIGWRDVFLGRKNKTASDKWDKHDWDKGQRVSPLQVVRFADNCTYIFSVKKEVESS